MLRLLVIDLATLVSQSARALCRAIEISATAVGLPCDRERARDLVGLSPFDAFRRIKTAPIPFPEHEKRLNRAVRMHDDIIAAHFAGPSVLHEQEGASDVLRSLRAQGIRLAIVTPLSRELSEVILRRTRWIAEGLVDTVVSADDVSYGRPRSDLVMECMRRADVFDLAEVGKLGSTPVDLAEGAVAGCGWNIGATWGLHSQEELYVRAHTHLIARIPALLDVVALGGPMDQRWSMAAGTYGRSSSCP